MSIRKWSSVLLVLSLTAAACGSDDDDDSSQESTSQESTSPAGSTSDGTASAETTTDDTTSVATASDDTAPSDDGALADDSVNGTGAEAWEAAVNNPTAADDSLEPVVITFANLEGTPVGSFPEVREGVEAAVKQINEQLGGIDGRPVQLEPCIHGLDPSEGTNCANSIVDASPTVHLNGVEFLSPVVYPVVLGAGIPIVNSVPIFVADTNTPGVVSPSQGCLAFAEDVRYMVSQGHDRIAVASALPLGPECYNDITLRALEVTTAGTDTTFEVFEQQAGDPSDDPAMVQAMTSFLDGASNPAIFLPESASDCNQHFNAIAAASLKASLYVADSCNEATVLANPNSVGMNVSVVDYAGQADSDPWVAFQIEARDAAFDALPVAAPVGSFMNRGYRVTLLAWTVLSQVLADGGDIDDPATVRAAFEGTESTYSFLAPPMDCVNVGTDYRSVCINQATHAVWDGSRLVYGPPLNGEFTNYVELLNEMATQFPRSG